MAMNQQLAVFAERLHRVECAGRTYTATNTIAEIIWEVLQRHATGIEFRERRAGQQLDSHMTWDGFVVTAGVRWADGSG